MLFVNWHLESKGTQRLMSGIGKIGLTLFLLSLASVALPATNTSWNSGKQAFERGDYESALAFFEEAHNGGLDSPAVHYNIAVAQFKLGRYETAGRTFSRIASRFPNMRGLAEYNLGLVALRLEEDAQAAEHFLRAWELSPDDQTIRVLASRRLSELEPDAGTVSRWSGAVGVRAGTDDNVALRDEAGLPVGDTADSPVVDTFFSIRGPRDGRNGFRFDANAYLVRYLDASDFDQSEVSGGAFYDWRANDWLIQIGAHASAGMLGGDSFDRKVGARGRLVRYLNRNSSFDIRYTYDDVADANDLFAGIEGSRHRFEARYLWYRDDHRMLFRFGLESNDRADPGVSPDRNRIALRYSYQPEYGVGYEAEIDFRESEYADLVSTREEDLLMFRAAVLYSFRNDWQCILESRISDNDSTDAAFSYDRTQLTFGALKFF